MAWFYPETEAEIEAYGADPVECEILPGGEEEHPNLRYAKLADGRHIKAPVWQFSEDEDVVHD